MATKKTTQKAAAAKSTTKKSTTAATKTTITRVVSAPTAATTGAKIDTKLPSNLVNIVIAEIIGTFVLTLVALFSAYMMAPFYVGLTLVIMVLAIGTISGAHINPAVTFGLWSMRKLKTVLAPFYWAAQFIGAMAAVVLLGALSGNGFTIHFDQFMSFSWSIFAVELIGMAVFMFGIAAVAARTDLRPTGKAVGIGMSLTLGLLVAGSLTPFVQSAAMTKYQEEQVAETAKKEEDKADKQERTYPRELYIGGATLNPAVALAVTEKTDSQLQSGSSVGTKDEKSYTRLSLEVIFATLIGAALGGNLYLLVSYRAKSEA